MNELMVITHRPLSVNMHRQASLDLVVVCVLPLLRMLLLFEKAVLYETCSDVATVYR